MLFVRQLVAEALDEPSQVIFLPGRQLRRQSVRLSSSSPSGGDG